MQKDQKKRRVAIYTRVSTEYQIERHSLPFQKDSLEKYAVHALNADSYEVFTDAGFSGTNIRRPAYLRMLQKIRSGHFTHLLVWRIDRISRNVVDFSELYEELQKYHVAFVSQTEQFDTSSAIGGAMLRIIMVFAQLESEMTAERIHAVLTSKAGEGEWTGGQPPYGYRYDIETKEITISSMESQVVTYIFHCYEILRSCRTIADLLNTQHFKTAMGNPWSAQAIEDILKNPFYIGALSYNRRTTKIHEAEEGSSSLVTVEEHHQSIVDYKLFKVCNHILSLQSNHSKARTRKQTHCHVLGGLLFCAKCGQPLLSQEGSTQKSGWKYSSYVCRGRRKKYCDNPYTSDLHLLPTLFFYLRSILQAQAKFQENWGVDNLETQLFCDSAAPGLRLTKKSLEELYAYMEKDGFSTLGLFPFESKVYRNILDVETERQKINTELMIVTNALTKLKKLYQYPESTMTEAAYTAEKEQIIKEIERLNQRLNVLNGFPSKSSGMDKDISVFNEILFSTSPLPPAEVFSKVNPLLLQEFMNRLLLQADIDDNRVDTLYFKNGLVQKFEIADPSNA